MGIAANVPALCDHTGGRIGRASGWPQLVPDNDPHIARVAGYYDAVNFARHAPCVPLMSAGYVDRTCPPTSIYAAFNVMAEPKRIVPTPTMGHSFSPEYNAACEKFIVGLGQLP